MKRRLDIFAMIVAVFALPAPGATQAQIQQRLNRKKSILDYSLAQASSLQLKLNPRDSAKLDCALGNTVNVIFDLLIQLVEQHAKRRQSWIRSVPESMFTLQLQIYSVRKTIIA